MVARVAEHQPLQKDKSNAQGRVSLGVSLHYYKDLQREGMIVILLVVLVLFLFLDGPCVGEGIFICLFFCLTACALLLGLLSLLVCLAALACALLGNFNQLLLGSSTVHQCGKLLAVHDLVLDKEVCHKVQLVNILCQNGLGLLKRLGNDLADLFVNDGCRLTGVVGASGNRCECG